MLINSLEVETIKQPNLLDKLAASEYKFYLTGSRYFVKYADFSAQHKVSDNTDYDYFTANNSSVIMYLKDLGFTYVAAKEWSKQEQILEEKDLKGVKVGGHYSSYNDENIVGVCFSPCRTIDVQIVKNVELKIEVQKILSCMGYHYYNLSKPQQKWLWNKQYERICKERNIVM